MKERTQLNMRLSKQMKDEVEAEVKKWKGKKTIIDIFRESWELYKDPTRPRVMIDRVSLQFLKVKLPAGIIYKAGDIIKPTKKESERMGRNLRRRLAISLKHNGTTKRNKTMIYVGCSKEELICHLESKFVEGMTWKNYGQWHIDHIMPVSSFNLNDENELFRMMSYTNLQPLWAHDNRVKSNKILTNTNPQL